MMEVFFKKKPDAPEKLLARPAAHGVLDKCQCDQIVAVF